MADDRLQSEIRSAVQEFIAVVVVHNVAIAARLGLGPSDSQFLTLLNLHGPMTPGQLAGASGLTSGTVTGVVDRLERAGFVRRERDSTDRRRVSVGLHPDGLARMAEEYRAHGEHLDRVLAARSSADLQVVRDFLADLTASPG